MWTVEQLVAEAWAWGREQDPNANEEGARRLVEAILASDDPKGC